MKQFLQLFFGIRPRCKEIKQTLMWIEMSKELCTKLEKHHGGTTDIVVTPLTVGNPTNNKHKKSIIVAHFCTNSNISMPTETFIVVLRHRRNF